jgi:hypothetical protein
MSCYVVRLVGTEIWEEHVVLIQLVIIHRPVFYFKLDVSERRSTFFYITYINSVRTSQEAQYISVL